MTPNKEKCPKCGAVEVDSMTPRTMYECGSSDYDHRPNTFNQSDKCKRKEMLIKGLKQSLIGYQKDVGGFIQDEDFEQIAQDLIDYLDENI